MIKFIDQLNKKIKCLKEILCNVILIYLIYLINFILIEINRDEIKINKLTKYVNYIILNFKYSKSNEINFT